MGSIEIRETQGLAQRVQALLDVDNVEPRTSIFFVSPSMEKGQGDAEYAEQEIHGEIERPIVVLDGFLESKHLQFLSSAIHSAGCYQYLYVSMVNA